MKKKKHVHTDFIRFILEKYSKQKENSDIKNDYDIEIPSDELEDEETNTNEDDDIIDELVNEYKKLKGQYENSKILNRRKRRTI